MISGQREQKNPNQHKRRERLARAVLLKLSQELS
jgi:hypothetical protein